MKFTTFYFSGTGNTRWAVTEFTQLIQAQGHQAESIAKFYQTLGVDAARCTRCMVCVNNCPTGSIQLKGNRFIFSSGCTACMRCYNFCPTGAISIDGVLTDPHKFPRYQGPQA